MNGIERERRRIRKRKQELGVNNYRNTILAQNLSVKEVNINDDDEISDYDEIEEANEGFTSLDLLKAMGPSRRFAKMVFHKEESVPVKLFTYENHTVKMKPVQNNAHESYQNCVTKRQWRERLKQFTELDLIGHKRDDKELFQEKNGAGGDVYIMIDGLPTNPNRTHHSMKEIRALTATNLLDLKDLEVPPLNLPMRPEATTKSVFADD